MKIRFHLFAILFVSQLHAQDEPVFIISFEKEEAEFEMGEPIRINCEFINTTCDVLHFQEHVFLFPKWEIFRNNEQINSKRGGSSNQFISPIKLAPFESKNFQATLLNDTGKLFPSQYAIRAILENTNTIGCFRFPEVPIESYLSDNHLIFEIKDGNSEMINSIKEFRATVNDELKITLGLRFLKEHEDSHLRDEVILEIGKAFFDKGEYERAINLLKEFEDSRFSTTDFERYEAFVRIGAIYFALEEYEKTIFYFKKLPQLDWVVHTIKEAEQKLNEKKN